MGLMGTLAKVAIGYAAARGVDHLSKNGGLGGLMGGAHVTPGAAQSRPNQMMQSISDMGAPTGAGSPFEGMQKMVADMMGGGQGGGNPAEKMQEMMAGLMGAAGPAGSGFQDMIAGLLGGGASSQNAGGGVLSGGGAGLAGLMAMAGGAAAATGESTKTMIDAFNPSETAPEAEAAAGLMLRAMIQAAKSDGGIDAEEQGKIMELVGEADAEDIAFIRAQLAAPVDIEALVADTPDAQKMQVYSMSLMAIRLDSQGEADYLDRLAARLGLDQQTVNALHLQMGVEPLYA